MRLQSDDQDEMRWLKKKVTQVKKIEFSKAVCFNNMIYDVGKCCLILVNLVHVLRFVISFVHSYIFQSSPQTYTVNRNRHAHIRTHMRARTRAHARTAEGVKS